MGNKIRTFLVDPVGRIIRDLYVDKFTSLGISGELEKYIETGSAEGCSEPIKILNYEDVNFSCDIEFREFELGKVNFEALSIYNPNPKLNDVTPAFMLRTDARSETYFKPAFLICMGRNDAYFDREYDADCPLSIEKIVEHLLWGNWDNQTMKMLEMRAASLADVG